jgi:alpha-beta hydrolase superfamily lysophospholipase
VTLVDHEAQQTAAAQAAWDEPTGLVPRGTLFVIPGRGEEPALYERLGRRLSTDAYRVRVLADPSADDATEAALHAALASQLASPDTVAPRVLVGSDTGALYAAGLTASGALDPDALILAGLPVGAGEEGTRSWDDELEIRTSCPTHRGVLRGAAVRRGALFGPVPDGWLERADLRRVRQPILGIHGAADPVSPLPQARERYRSAPLAQLVSISDGKHDALNDLTHRTVAATVVLFLERLRLGKDLPVIASAELPEERRD